MELREFDRACLAIERSGRGSIRLKDGTVVSGEYGGCESEYDDVENGGCVYLRCGGGHNVFVTAGEFAELLEPKEPR